MFTVVATSIINNRSNRFDPPIRSRQYSATPPRESGQSGMVSLSGTYYHSLTLSRECVEQWLALSIVYGVFLYVPHNQTPLEQAFRDPYPGLSACDRSTPRCKCHHCASLCAMFVVHSEYAKSSVYTLCTPKALLTSPRPRFISPLQSILVPRVSCGFVGDDYSRFSLLCFYFFTIPNQVKSFSFVKR